MPHIKLTGKDEKWGLWDSQDNSWLGDKTGPFTYDDETLAKLAREAFVHRFKWNWLREDAPKKIEGDVTPYLRLQVIPYVESPVHLKDTVECDPNRDPVLWLERKEKGSIL